MSIKWTVFIFIFMLGCSVLFAIIEQSTTNVGGATVMEELSAISVWQLVNPVSYLQALFTDSGWVNALLDAALFNYAMFQDGAWVYVRYFFFAIGLAWLVSLVVTLARGVATSA